MGRPCNCLGNDQYTVKLVVRDSSRDFRKKVTYDRWSLNLGWIFFQIGYRSETGHFVIFPVHVYKKRKKVFFVSFLIMRGKK
jgi:hypothetical protein